MAGRAVLVTALAVLGATMTGCGTPAPEHKDSLAGACQFKSCVCADANAPFWQRPQTAPIIWHEGTGPTCPPGFALRRTEEK